MEDLTKMVNKAIPQKHISACRCEVCLTKLAYNKVAERNERNKASIQPSAQDGRPRYGVTRFMMFMIMMFLTMGISFSQDPNVKRFSVFKATTLGAAAEVITIQQPATGGKVIRIESVDVWCSVACEATLERDGTAATTTALTPVVITYGTIAAKAFSASNVGVGTVITIKEIPANSTVPVSFSGGLYISPIDADGDATDNNFSVRTNSITGDVKITIVGREGR